MKLHLRRIQPSDFPKLMSWIHTEGEMVPWSGPWNFEFPLDDRQLAKYFLTETLDDKIHRMQFMAVDEDCRIEGRRFRPTDGVCVGRNKNAEDTDYIALPRIVPRILAQPERYGESGNAMQSPTEFVSSIPHAKQSAGDSSPLTRAN